MTSGFRIVTTAAALVAVPATGIAQNAPVSILPPPAATSPAPAAPATTIPAPVVPVVPTPVLPSWTLANAEALAAAIAGIGSSGLLPADYEPEALKTAIAAGEGVALDAVATRLFQQLAMDLRDGRTPKKARVEWIVKDSDADRVPVDGLLSKALESGNISGALAGLEPTHPDYALLKAALAATKDPVRQKVIRANMDRWRWLPQTLGPKHLLANVPEYMLRVNVHGKNIATYRVIVGKKGTTTPQLSAPATGIVVHPPWVLPRSIINEEVGPMIARNPAAAKARGYTWTGSGKTLSVVQQPGPNAALGLLKIDMPNPDAIFIHDTPNRGLFGSHPRAFSHGCLRTERAFELGILLGILQSGHPMDDAVERNRIADELVRLIKAGKTAKVPFKEPIPVFIGYFTLASAGDGKLQSFVDVYGRDGPVLASFDKPREPKALPSVAPKPVSVPTPVTAGTGAGGK